MANTTSSSTAPASIAEDWNSRGLPHAAVGAIHGAALNAAFLSFDVCLAATYVLLSKPSERRSTLFRLHLLSFICAGAFFIIQIALQPQIVFLYATQTPNGIFDVGASLTMCRWLIASDFFSVFGPLVADSTLFFKLSAMYPSWTASRTKRLFVLGPFLTALITRLILYTLLVWQDISGTDAYIKSGGSIFFNAGKVVFQSILIIIDFSLQILSCSYVSALILLRAYRYRKQMRAKIQRKGLADNEKNLRHKLNLFVESILMGFVPPLLCQVLYLATFHSSVITIQAISTYTGTANVFLSAFFAVLATTWSTVRDVVPRRFSSPQDHPTLPHEEQTGPNRMKTEKSILSNFLERAGGDGDDEEDIEFVDRTQSSPDEEKSTPALPLKGTSEWRTHLSRQLGSKQQRPPT
ncbi:hypothetical protein FA10DRAFT_301278 [Acaromyces ingoldii]|uniref:G-protein coupled receptors family 1 profile domain-containing protein n=1 Tax=Acaromyces ingoldii TaxID=215250 RepID=A0A316YLP4_9BASI|nr:hypothetical protein FA10DRAFT_301278 [Acaromyces ingoldii]PWN89986.1 hypothetical protein FA10DRAFT_301278 [Acaromyces ingoldii]